MLLLPSSEDIVKDSVKSFVAVSGKIIMKITIGLIAVND